VRRTDRAIAALLFVSGAAALAYEVLWARDWALLYGSTATGVTVVLVAYFAGLALGARVGGWLAGRGDSLRVYAALEVGAAVAVVVYLAARPALPGAAAWIARTTAPDLLPVVRTLFALAVLLVPATLLGATLPAATAALGDAGAIAAGRLYAANTLGGAAGAIVCGFVAVRTLGVHGTFLAAAGLDVLIAGVAMRLTARRAPEAPAEAAPASGITLVAAATGFVGLAGEVLWTRGLAGVLSSSVYSVALVLAAVLLGIVLGAAVAVRVLRRTTAVARWLAIAAASLAIALVGSRFALSALPDVSLAAIRALGVRGPGAGLAVEALLALLVVLLPAVLLGTMFPLTLALAGSASPGSAMARVLAANTAGGIAGALAGAFVLLPRVGLGGGLFAAAALMATVAAATAPARGPRIVAAIGAIAALAIAVVAPPLHLPWRAPSADRLLFYRDGATATVMVTADPRGQKRLRVNGQYSLGGTDGLLLESREAHVPLLLHPRPTRVLHLGVGTGDTIGAELTHPGVTVDGVELVAETLAAAALFAPENHGVLGNPRAHLVADDARSYLLASDASYDVILSDLFLPWTAGTASLYSLDFYRLGLAHLRSGGLYCQWLPLHQLAVTDLEAIVATFTTVFPHVGLWVAYHRSATPLAALVGSATPLATTADGIRARLADPTLAPALAAAGLDSSLDLASLYVTDASHLRAATAGTAPITDDRPRLEFTAPAAYFHQEGLGRAALGWVAARLDPTPVAWEPRATFALRRALLGAELALLDGDGPGELKAYLEAFTIAPETPGVRRALVAIGRDRLAAGDRGTARVIGDALRQLAPDSREAGLLAVE
jgi:spermidine synthase